MALTLSVTDELGKNLPDFNLKNIDGNNLNSKDYSNTKVLVVVFICNHCPYVIAAQSRITAIARDYNAKGVALIAINSNDATQYPEDSFEEMQAHSKRENFVFPYLYDPTQEVARAFNAVCTPDPFMFENTDQGFKLRYHGRVDNNWKDESKVTVRDLRDALDAIILGKLPSPNQVPAMGCSIKWAR